MTSNMLKFGIKMRKVRLLNLGLFFTMAKQFNYYFLITSDLTKNFINLIE